MTKHGTGLLATAGGPGRPARAMAGAAAAASALLLIPAGAASAVAQARPAASATGTLQAWGSNRWGELGSGTAGNSDVPVVVRLPAGTVVAGVAAGGGHSLARTAAGQVLAWGRNTEGQLGDGTTSNSSVPVPVKLPAGITVTSVKAGCADSLALTSRGRVLDWGMNTFGELGDGTRRNSDTPVRVRLPRGVKITAISAGCYFNLALTASGRVLAWGRNDIGSLGDGNFRTTSLVPVSVRLRPGIRVTSISAGSFHGTALAADGRVYGWGYNRLGQVGDGTTRSRDIPVMVKLPRNLTARVVALADGGAHSLALLSDGTMLAWGINDFGQLGTGTGEVSSPTMIKLPPGVKVKAISIGTDSSIALTSTGGVLAWGANHSGQLGDGSTSDSGTPVQVMLAAGLVAIGIGGGPEAAHNFAIVQTRP